ncbi:MAG: hypothetical protein ACI9XB_001698, partial [Gammaproteobacteria bacterium]
MKLIKTVLALLFLFSYTANLFCQSKIKTTELSEVRKNKSHIEIGLRSFKSIWDNTASGTILFKRTYSTGDLVEVNSIKLLRAYLTINSQINFTDDPSRTPEDSTDVQLHPSDRIDLTLGLGFEKQKRNKSFVHYYGNDFFCRYFKSDDDYPNGSIGGLTLNNTSTTDRLVRTLKAGVNPFIGIKYYFTDQISLGIETGFQMFYFNSKFTEVSFENVGINGQNDIQFVKKTPVVSDG